MTTQKRWKRILIAVCFVLTLIVLSRYCYIDSEASANTTGYTTTSSGTGTVTIRSGPGTSYSSNGKLNVGTKVVITGETNGWYAIKYSTITGYIRCDLITNITYGTSSDAWNGTSDTGTSGTDTGNTGTVSDTDFYNSLIASGFPESYASKLTILHQNYPNWVFQPVKTGLDWNTVISNESTIGKSLIRNTYADGYKSTDSKAYNWSANTWYGLDGSSWVAANSDVVAYYMDPRNFMDASTVFQFASLKYENYQNLAGINTILSGTFMSGSLRDSTSNTYANLFLTAGKTYSVNPYFLAAKVKVEQGINGSSGSVSGTVSGYQGYSNYYNIRAWAANGNSAVVNGLIYAKKQGWNSVTKSINGGTSYVTSSYIAKGQDTYYTQKFNVVYTESLYSHQYATDIMNATSQGKIFSSAYTDKSQAIVFYIPVYNNMPASACSLPNTGNPNNWLSSLSVSGYLLTPSFSGGTSSYSMIVGSGVSSVNVSAKAVASTSSISGTGTVNLNYGNNTVNVVCTAGNGSQKAYTITITREKAASTTTVIGNAKIDSPYSFATYATGIPTGSSASSVISSITTSNCSVKILNSDGSVNSQTVGTGDYVAVYDTSGAVLTQYQVVIYGDVNGDGKISNSDILFVIKNNLGIKSLSGIYATAGDISKDGKVSNTDLLAMKKHVLGIKTISQ